MIDREATEIFIEALKEEGIDLVVTLPEDSTYPLTEAIRADPYFTDYTVAGENHGIAICAGASLGGRKCIFITGIAGLLVGSWALAQLSLQYNIPLLIAASYRGDIGDKSGIPSGTLLMFKRVAEPLIQALQLPYRVVDQKSRLKRMIRDGHVCSRQYSVPLVLLLTGEVLW